MPLDDALNVCNSCGLVTDPFNRKSKIPAYARNAQVFDMNCLIYHDRLCSGVKPYRCTESGKIFSRAFISFSCMLPILRRTPIPAWNVGRPYMAGHIVCSTTRFTLVRNINSKNVERSSLASLLPSFIRGTTLRKNLLYEKNVMKPFNIGQVWYSVTHTGEKLYEYMECGKAFKEW